MTDKQRSAAARAYYEKNFGEKKIAPPETCNDSLTFSPMPIMGHSTNTNNLRPNPNASPFYPQRTPKPELRLNPNASNFHPDSTIPITPPTIRDLIQYYGNLSTDHKNLSNI